MTYGFAENMMKSLTWTFILIMVGHWNACVLYLIPSETLTHQKFNKPFDGSFDPTESLKQSWIYVESGLDTLPEGERYLRLKISKNNLGLKVLSSIVQINVSHVINRLRMCNTEYH